MQASLLVLLVLFADVGGVWWSQEPSLSNNICRRTQNFFRRGGRTEFCRTQTETVETVLKGVELSIEECQHHFRNRRWNCSTTRSSIRRIMRYDYRETAFIFAITSAGISFSVTRACSTGDLEFCSCRPGPSENPNANSLGTQNGNAGNRARAMDIRRVQRATNQLPSKPDAEKLEGGAKSKQFEWGGCNDNIVFGTKISKEFMNSARNNRDLRARVQRHNNLAGRLAVETNMKTECKCVGLSGSCSVKTCWKKMPHFRFVSDDLKLRFDGASKVISSNKGDALLTETRTIKAPTDLDLVYTTDSPNFCTYNALTGSLGTKGRRCDKTSKAVEGCGLLCCGRPSRKTHVVVRENCNCRFHWCCEVICQVCKTEKTIFTCS